MQSKKILLAFRLQANQTQLVGRSVEYHSPCAFSLQKAMGKTKYADTSSRVNQRLESQQQSIETMPQVPKAGL